MLEGLLVHGGVKGEREAVLAMEAGGIQFAETLLSIRVPRWRLGVGLQTARAPADPPNRIPGTKGWRGRKRPR